MAAWNFRLPAHTQAHSRVDRHNLARSLSLSPSSSSISFHSIIHSHWVLIKMCAAISSKTTTTTTVITGMAVILQVHLVCHAPVRPHLFCRSCHCFFVLLFDFSLLFFFGKWSTLQSYNRSDATWIYMYICTHTHADMCHTHTHSYCFIQVTVELTANFHRHFVSITSAQVSMAALSVEAPPPDSLI